MGDISQKKPEEERLATYSICSICSMLLLLLIQKCLRINRTRFGLDYIGISQHNRICA